MPTSEGTKTFLWQTLKWLYRIATGGSTMILLVWAVSASVSNNQIVRPFPWAPDVPVVPALPNLIADLRRLKTVCEGRATAARECIRGLKIAPSAAAVGRDLYNDAEAESSACVSYLQSGLIRRFNPADSEIIATRMDTAKRKIETFLDWADRSHNSIRDTPPSGVVSYSTGRLGPDVLQWLEAMNTANDKAIAVLRLDLEACRMKNWEQIP